VHMVPIATVHQSSTDMGLRRILIAVICWVARRDLHRGASLMLIAVAKDTAQVEATCR
jgi:hypothetical protein